MLWGEAEADVLLVDPAVLRTPAASFLQEIREAGHPTEVLYLVSYRALGEALGAMRAGAFGFVAKPIDWEEVRLLVERAAERKTLREEVDRLREHPDAAALVTPAPDAAAPATPAPEAEASQVEAAQADAVAPKEPEPVPVRFELSYEPDVLVGSSPAVERIRAFIARMTGTDAPILLEGPRGAGRTQVARAIHFGGTRAGGPLVDVDGAELNRERAELELRGVARGARVGKASPQPGLIERAHGGTLIIRHPDFLPAEAQERIYGYLNSGVVVPVAEPGHSSRVHVDTRVIFISERPLSRMVDVGSLLPELSRVLGGQTLEVPALRSRLEDLSALARVHMARMGWPNGELEEAALQWLEAQGWPGNLRQFEEAMRRAMRAMVEAGRARPLRLIDFSTPSRFRSAAPRNVSAEPPPRMNDEAMAPPTRAEVAEDSDDVASRDALGGPDASMRASRALTPRPEPRAEIRIGSRVTARRTPQGRREPRGR